MNKKLLSVLLAAVMLLSLIPMTVFAETPEPAGEVYRPYDLTLTTDTIIFKEDVNVSDYVTRWDMFILAGNSGETAPIRVDINEFDAEGFKLYEGYCIKANGSSEVSEHPGATFKKLDDDTFEITIIPSKINAVKFLGEGNPYIWLVVAPCDAYNRLDQTKGTSGHYDVYNSTVCLGRFGSMENFKTVTTLGTYAITNGTPESDKAKNNGYITIDKETAAKDDTVTITVKPNEGYQLKSLTVAPAVSTFKAVYNTNGDANTLTFYYDAVDHSGEGITVYEDGTTDYLFDNSKSKGAKWGYNGIRHSVTSVVIDSTVANYTGLTSTAYMFDDMEYAENISGAEYLDVSQVTNMAYMFNEYGYQSSTLNIVPDVSEWNTGKVTNMSYMFQKYGYKSTALNAVPDVSEWNTVNVTTVTYMFYCYGNYSTALSTVPNVSKWNTGNLTNIASMFSNYGCSSIKLNFTLDLSDWSVASVDNTSSAYRKMFESAATKAGKWSVTIPRFTGAQANNETHWYVGDGTATEAYIEPASGKTFTLVEYVEIGGVKWATKNLGAEKETDNGYYFAWGETAPYYEGTGGWPATPTWKSGKESGYAWQSYCGSSSFSEWSTTPYDATTKILKPEFDAAAQILGNGWRMPTIEEFKAMKDATYWAWDSTDNGYYVFAPDVDHTAGTKVSSIPGDLNKNDALLFFPATGRGDGTNLDKAGYGYYWSSSLKAENTGNAYDLSFNSSIVLLSSNSSRYYGRPVRPVKDAAPANKLLKSSAPKQLKSTAPAAPETITPAKQQDGTYQFTMPAKAVTVTAEFEEKAITIADIIATYENFPLTKDEDLHWTNKQGTTCYYFNNNLFFRYSDNKSLMQSMTVSVAADGKNYTYSDGIVTYTFIMDDSGVLAAITVSGSTDIKYNGTYVAPPTKYTVTNGTTDMNGDIAIDKASAAEGETVTITVKPNEGYQLKSLTVTPEAPAIAGALKGEFSVSADKKVYFSQGNLVATIDASGAPTAWKFAANQYESIGANVANTKIGKEAGDIDLFGWSTDAASNNWGIHTKTSETKNFTTGNFKDWGKAVGDGNTWRTLSKAEWTYLFNNHSKKWATVNGVKGYVIAPDGFDGTLSDTYADDAALAANNLVFLPAAGDRAAFSVTVFGSDGFYWSSSTDSEDEPYDLHFTSSSVKPNRTDKRNIGMSVRLVTEVKAVDNSAPANEPLKSPAPVDPETITPTKQQDGTYQFKMPAKAVTVTAEFEHTHAPVLVNGQAATESAAGWKDYYECNCGALSEDENGTTPIENLDAWKAEGGNGYIAPLIHNPELVNGQDATDTEAGYKPYYECENCGKCYEDATELVPIDDINIWKAEGGDGYLAPLHGTDDNHDHICDYCDRQVSEHNGVLVEGTAATEEAAGFKSYYKCECGKFFEDAAGEVEITDLDAWQAEGGSGYIAPIKSEEPEAHEHKLVKQNGKAATKDAAGYKDYYKCDCGKLFEDATGKVEITDLEKWQAEGGSGYIAKLGEPTSPATSDSSNTALLLMLLALTSAGAGACLVLDRKKRAK